MKAPVDPSSLRGVPLFATMSDTQLVAIARVAEILSRSRDEIIVREHDEDGGFFILLEGSAKVLVTASDGREAVLAILTEGDFFGEMSLLDGDPRSATVRTATVCRLLCIQRERFIELLRDCPDIAVGLLVELSLRLRQANRRIEALTLMPVNGRISAAILQLCDTQGVRVHSELRLHGRPTQAEIAKLAGTTREAVSRALNVLRREGIIALDGKDLVVRDEKRLRQGIQ